MSLTFAGVPLLLEDPGHTLQHWLERCIPLDDARLWGDRPAWERDRTSQPKTAAAYQTGIPVPNWPAPPRMKPNSLWWPTGATRWAHGLFLVDGERLQAIENNLNADGSGSFVMHPEATGEIGMPRLSATLWPLTPRPLSAYNPDNLDLLPTSNLWLLPLVDVRYFWQQRDVELQTNSQTTWNDLFDRVYTALGSPTMVQDGIDAGAYFRPHYEEWARAMNAAMALDALAWSVGQRVVFFGDTLYLMNAATSVAVEGGNQLGWPPGLSDAIGVGTFFEEGYYTLAGGTIRGALWPLAYPAKVRVYFPRENSVTKRPYAIDITAAEAGWSGTTHAGLVKTFWCSSPADFSDSSSAADPGNLSDIRVLAVQIATDYYAHLGYGYDATFVGLRAWFPSGITDYLWWHYGSQHESETPGDYAAYTRVASLPPDVGISEMLHQTQMPQGEGERWFVLTEQLDAGGSADAHPVNWNPAGSGAYSVDLAATSTLYDTSGGSWGLAHEWILARLICADDGAFWEVVRPGATWYEATLQATLERGGTVAAQVTVRGQTTSVMVTDRFLEPGDTVSNGGRVGITYDVENMRLVATEAVCS